MSKCICKIVSKGEQRDSWTAIEYCSLHVIAEELFNEVLLFIELHDHQMVDLKKLVELTGKVKQESKFV